MRVTIMTCQIKRVTRGRGRGFPCPFSKIGKKSPDFGEIHPYCCHLWFKFIIQNVVFKFFYEEKPEIFEINRFFHKK